MIEAADDEDFETIKTAAFKLREIEEQLLGRQPASLADLVPLAKAVRFHSRPLGDDGPQPDHEGRLAHHLALGILAIASKLSPGSRRHP